MTDVLRISACRLCDGPNLDLVVSFTPTPPGDQYLITAKEQPCYPLDVLCCRGCGAVQLADTVDPKLIYPEYLYTTSVSKGLDKHFADYANSVMARVGATLKPRSLVVDIGSNDGTLLQQFKIAGRRVLGVDPAQQVAKDATANGIDTLCAFFSQAVAREIQKAHGWAQVITANHILANVADLHEFIEGVKHLLAPNGTFVFETGYWPAIVDGNLIDTIEHEHIHYFAVKPLAQVFALHGLRLVHVEQNDTKGGSLRGYVEHAAHSRADDTVAELIEMERPYTVPHFLSDWEASLQQIEAHVRELSALAPEETWVGYGASVGSTLQLHQFGLGEKLTALVDVNPAKQGRLSPGYHLPVYDPCRLPTLQPDVIVILAWRYQEMIRAQHPEFTGKWLIPLPQVVKA